MKNHQNGIIGLPIPNSPAQRTLRMIKRIARRTRRKDLPGRNLPGPSTGAVRHGRQTKAEFCGSAAGGHPLLYGGS